MPPVYSDPLTPIQILQTLIRFDTTNPPGNERDCILWIENLLRSAGLETRLLALQPERPNLVARLRGNGLAAPLLLYGHVDVVTTAGQDWTYPPFAGVVQDGYVWGRGALDMKGGLAIMIAALLRTCATGVELPGDVIFAAVCDEEELGNLGAQFLVEQHAELFAGVRYALGEFGGFTLIFNGKRFYPIMVAEKQACWMRAIVRGQGGHGSMPVRRAAMARLANLLLRLDRHRLPVHITPVAQMMIEQFSMALPASTGLLLRQLLNPRLTDRLIDLLGARGRSFDPLFHNTVSPTILRASEKINVIPDTVVVELDGRVLPNFNADDMLSELHAMIGDQIKLEVVKFEPGPAEPDLSFFDTLAGILREEDPQGIPVPFLLSGVTDARFFSTLGIQTYGFLPMDLPPEFDFASVIHAADERIPVGALEFGTRAIMAALQCPRP